MLQALYTGKTPQTFEMGKGGALHCQPLKLYALTGAQWESLSIAHRRSFFRIMPTAAPKAKPVTPPKPIPPEPKPKIESAPRWIGTKESAPKTEEKPPKK